MRDFLARRSGMVLALVLAPLVMSAPPQARAEEPGEPEAALPADEEEVAVPESLAARHEDTMCASLDALLAKTLAAPERHKALETRQSLHCPATSSAAPGPAQESAARP